MPGNRTGCDNIVRVIELHKVGKSYREIEKATGVNESTVGRLVKTMARRGGGGGKHPSPRARWGQGPKDFYGGLKASKVSVRPYPLTTAKELKEKNPKLSVQSMKTFRSG